MTPTEQAQIEAQMNRYKGTHMQRDLDVQFLLGTMAPPIFIEPKRVGAFEVKVADNQAGSILTVVSQRNSLMMGYKPIRLETFCNRKIHSLHKDGQGMMMSDSPQEMFLQYEALQAAKGRVLTSGLGIGMFSAMAARKEEVTELVIVEIEPDIIDLISFEHKKATILCEDIWGFLRTTADTDFDFIYIDIHYRTGATEYINTVLPMKKILEKRFAGILAMFWAEEEMESQYIPDYKKEKK